MKQEDSEKVTRTAITWFLRLQAGEVSHRRKLAYVQWLKRSPDHVAEAIKAANLYWLLGAERDRLFRPGAITQAGAARSAQEYVRQTIVTPITATKDGVTVRASSGWLDVIARLESDPQIIYQIPWRRWEEIVAGAYERAGFDVELTPRSNDGGRDVIASRHDLGTYRIFDQIKAYAPGRLVTAEVVRAMLGVLDAEPNVSKAFITTTSDFAPGVYRDPRLTQYMPYRLELRPHDALLQWLTSVRNGMF